MPPVTAPPPPPVDLPDDGDEDLHVLVTGYGQFAGLDPNPAWLAVKPLHNLILDLDKSTAPHTASSSDQTAPSHGVERKKRKALVQCIQVPVAWRAVLDIVPRLHGLDHAPSPHAEPWLDPKGEQGGWAGDGRSFPLGYQHVRLPPSRSQRQASPTGSRRRFGRWDLILHVGTGRNGAIALENLAHKDKYRPQSLDVRKEGPPPIRSERSLESALVDKEWSAGVVADEATRAGPSTWSIPTFVRSLWRSLLNLFHPSSPTVRRIAPTFSYGSTEDKARATDGSDSFFFQAANAPVPERDYGFGAGYEPFKTEEHTVLDLDALEAHLRATLPESGPLRQSRDPGRYLCDFIYYASLAESRRQAREEEGPRREGQTPVLFIHCPTVGQPQTSEQVTNVLTEVVRWVCQRSP